MKTILVKFCRYGLLPLNKDLLFLGKSRICKIVQIVLLTPSRTYGFNFGQVWRYDFLPLDGRFINSPEVAVRLLTERQSHISYVESVCEENSRYIL